VIRLLLWVEWRTLRHSGVTVRRLATIAMIAFFIAIMLAAFTRGAYALATVSGIAEIDALAGIGIMALFLILLLYGIPSIFNTLFGSRDVELLFTLPIPTRSIYLTKFGQSLATIGLLAIVVSLAPMIGFGAGANVGWLYYLVLPLAVATAVLGAIAICSLACLLLVQLVPVSRIKEGLTALYVLSGLLPVGIWRALPQLGTHRFEQLPLMPVWTPMRWGGSALSRAAHDEVLAFVPLLGLLALAIGLLAISTTLVERGFRLGWIQLSQGEQRRKRAGKTPAIASKGRLPGPLIVIGLKELRTLQRDIREWTQVVPSLVFFGFAIFRVLDSNSLSLLRSNSRGVWLLAQAALVGMVASSAMTLAAPALAREGPGLWLLRSLPISSWKLTLGKFWVYWLIPATLVMLAEIGVGIAFGWNPGWIAIGLVVVSIILSGAVAIGICLGTYGARYDPDHPARRLERGLMLALLVIEFLYLLVAMVPAGATLLPTSLQPALAEEASRQGGMLHVILQAAHFIVSQKASHGALVDAAGWTWLWLFGLGVTALMLSITAQRIESGVQIEIVQGG